MNDIVRSQIFTAIRYLIDYASPLNRIIAFDVSFEGASITIFGDEIAVIIGVEDIDKFDDMIVLQPLHDGYFVIEQVNVSHVHIFHFDHFYRKRLALTAFFCPSINSAAEPTADKISVVEGVFSNAFLSSVFLTDLFLSVTLFHID